MAAAIPVAIVPVRVRGAVHRPGDRPGPQAPPGRVGPVSAPDPAGPGSPPAEGEAIRIERLHKSFGPNVVLRGIDLSVATHEVICLIGASGSGKSTLLR